MFYISACFLCGKLPAEGFSGENNCIYLTYLCPKYLLVIFCVCMCIHMCAHGCGGQRSTSGTHLRNCPSWLLRQCLSLYLVLTDEARLASLLFPGTVHLLFYSGGILSAHHNTWYFLLGSRIKFTSSWLHWLSSHPRSWWVFILSNEIQWG